MDKGVNQLIGIKAIADYLDMSVRNVYHWEKRLGLPLHRLSGSSGYRLYAYKEEIDQWMKSKDAGTGPKKNSRKFHLFLFALIAVLGLPAILFFTSLLEHKSGPEILTTESNTIYVKNAKGKILWHFFTKGPANVQGINLLVDMADIDGDSHKEVIACTYDIRKDQYSITLFDHNGRVHWSRRITPNQTFNQIEIKDFFRPGPVKFARSKDNGFYVISKWNHQERFLSLIAAHHPDGRLLHQYLHVGNLTYTMELIDLNGDGEDEILFTGTNNLLNGEGIVGVLPLRNFHGISPPYAIEPEYAHLTYRLLDYIADDVEPGNQLLYIRFKHTDYLPKFRADFTNTELVYNSENLIQIRLFPWTLPVKAYLHINYLFDKKFKLKKVLTPYTAIIKYPELVQTGEIDISLEALIKVYSHTAFRWDNGRWVPVDNEIGD